MALADLTPLQHDLAQMILTACRLVDVDPNQLTADGLLVGPGSVMGLDSLDMVEVVVAVQAKYNVRIDGRDDARRVFVSLKTLADFIEASRAK